MIKKNKFLSFRYEKNDIFSQDNHTDYEQSKQNRDVTRATSNQNQKKSSKLLQDKQQIIDLQDLWDNLNQPELKQADKSSFDEKKQEPIELDDDEFNQIFGEKQIKQEITESHKSGNQIVDLEDIWNNLDNDQHNKQSFQKNQSKEEQSIKQLQPQVQQIRQPVKLQSSKQIQQSPSFKIEQFEQENTTSVKLILNKDFQIYDTYEFIFSNYRKSTYGYFGFESINENSYIFSNLLNNQPLIICQRVFEKAKSAGSTKNNNFETRLLFKLPNTKEQVAVAFQKKLDNGVVYNLKYLDPYTEEMSQTASLIEISDGYINKNCYCKTLAFIPAEENKQTATRLAMSIGFKNGFLTAKMGVNGIISSPYNCRLENPKRVFTYLLGLYDDKNNKFLIRVGEGISPIISFAISVARKIYIDSFID